MINIKKSLITLFFVLFLVGVAGCNNENSGLPAQHGNGSISGGGDTGGGSIEVTLISLAVTPKPFDLANGLTKQLTAIATYSDDSTKNVTNEATWSSSSDLIATVSNIGLVTAKSSTGTATITAVFDSVLSETQVTTIGPELASLEIAPSNTTVSMAQLTDPANSKVNYTATALYSDGSSKPATELVTWESDNTSLATVLSKKGASSGLATPIAAGNLNIKATLTELGVTKSASSVLTVTGPTLVSITVSPKKLLLISQVKIQLHATGQYSDGSTQDITKQVSWNYSGSSCVIDDSNPNFPNSCFVVLESSGVIFNDSYSANSKEDNHTIITATSNANPNLTDSTDITARDDTPEQVTINPAVINIPKGLTKQLKATSVVVEYLSVDVTDISSDGATDNDGGNWNWGAASNSGDVMLDITQTGLITASVAGLSSVTFSRGGKNVTSQVTIKDIQITSLKLVKNEDPTVEIINPLILPKGSTEKIKVMATYDDGSTYDVTDQATLTLTSDDGSVVAIKDGNNIYASGAGTATVSASFNTVTSEQLNVSITDTAVTGIVITPKSSLPDPLDLPTGTSTQLIATATFSDGTTRDITDEAYWTTSDSNSVSVNSLGLVSANEVTNGANISVSFRGYMSSTSITVTNATLNGFTVAPDPAVTTEGGTIQLIAIGTFNDGHQQDVTNAVSYLMGNEPLDNYDQVNASITDTGLVQGIKVGSANVLCVYRGTTILSIIPVSVNASP